MGADDMARRRKERIIICVTCGKEVVTKGTTTKRCPECSKINTQRKNREYQIALSLMRENNAENNSIWFHDSPEDIQKCLECKKPKCKNCLQSRKKA
jgi:DNA-directed RNA polymerase subunit RPC12/RpoP